MSMMTRRTAPHQIRQWRHEDLIRNTRLEARMRKRRADEWRPVRTVFYAVALTMFGFLGGVGYALVLLGKI